MFKAIHNRLALCERINAYGIKTALLTFLYMMVIGSGYILTDWDFFIAFILLGVFIGIIINGIMMIAVLIQLLRNVNRTVETLFTIYILLLNIPMAFLLILLNDFSNQHFYS